MKRRGEGQAGDHRGKERGAAENLIAELGARLEASGEKDAECCADAGGGEGIADFALATGEEFDKGG